MWYDNKKTTYMDVLNLSVNSPATKLKPSQKYNTPLKNTIQNKD